MIGETCSGEHGVGLRKKESLKKELGVETINVIRDIKKALDPCWLMNPGIIFDHPALDAGGQGQDKNVIGGIQYTSLD